MSIVPIVQWPDERLTTVCAPVGEVTDEIRILASNMLETMYAAPGRGLAAPQVGMTIRMFVMDPDWKEGAEAPQVLLNPEIVAISDETVEMQEGCLSIPGIVIDVERPEAIRLRWTTLSGEEKHAELTGPAARVAQHEIDHLDGVLMYDRLDGETRDAVLSALEADLV